MKKIISLFNLSQPVGAGGRGSPWERVCQILQSITCNTNKFCYWEIVLGRYVKMVADTSCFKLLHNSELNKVVYYMEKYAKSSLGRQIIVVKTHFHW